MKCGKALSEKIKSDRFIDIKRPLKFHKVINLSQNIAQLSITAKTVRKLLTCVPTYTQAKSAHFGDPPYSCFSMFASLHRVNDSRDLYLID